MATFRIPDADVAAWDSFETETASRLEGDFTVNTFKNINKNYKKKIKCCNDGRNVVIRPESCPTRFLTIQPDSETCPINHTCYQIFTVDPEVGAANDYVCKPAPPIEQIPFVLASRGILFRHRNVPYFTSAGGTSTFMDEVVS